MPVKHAENAPRSKSDKQEVNETHCCVCFKLRSTILISICVSLILIIVYGYKYWMNPSSRIDSPTKFYGYSVVAGFEVILCIIGWIGIYNHIRSITKYFTYWIIIHILIIVMVFWVSTLFDYLHIGFFIAWIVVQVILLLLLWRFKQILKIHYGWDDTEESEEQSDQAPEAQRAPMKLDHEHKDNNQNKSNVNVTVNLNMSQPQQQPQTVYQPPMQQQMPMQMYNQYPMMQHPMHQQMPHQMQQQMYNQYPPMDPLPDAPIVSPKHTMQQYTVNAHANVEEKAPPQQDNVRIAVYHGNEEQDEAEPEPQQIPNGIVSNIVKVEKPSDAITSQFSYSNDTENEQMYAIDQKRTNDARYEGGEGQLQVNLQQDMIIHGDSSIDLIGATNANKEQREQFMQQRPRVKTPDPPPPPNLNEIDEVHAINGSDEDVLGDDFIAEIKPDAQRTQGVNLYFLDSGNKLTGGYSDQQ